MNDDARPTRTLATAGWVDQKALPRGPNGRACCRYCGNECAPPRLTFCSAACVHEHKIRSNPGYARLQVWKRDKGVCAICKKACASISKSGTEWQADHIVPVVEGGGSCGLENLRTLCTSCHAEETRKLAGRRAAAKRAEAVSSLTFTVPGEPVAKERPRTRVVTPRTRVGKAFAHVYTPGKTKAYEARVALVAQAEASRVRWPFTAAERFTVTIRVFRTYLDKGGDWDNYAKAICDALNGIAWADDRHVRGAGVVVKQDKEHPRVEVTVRRITEE